MEFFNVAMKFVINLLGKIEGFIGFALKVLGFAKDFFPNLIEIIEPLIQVEQMRVDEVMEDPESTPEDIEDAKEMARETVVDLAKEVLSASPRFVPEPIIRMVMEAVYYTRKFMVEEGTYYDSEEIKEHATEWLKTWGGHGK